MASGSSVLIVSSMVSGLGGKTGSTSELSAFLRSSPLMPGARSKSLMTNFTSSALPSAKYPFTRKSDR
ncbi:MAG: hypothetical protein ACK55Z_11560 [bacterium]